MKTKLNRFFLNKLIFIICFIFLCNFSSASENTKNTENTEEELKYEERFVTATVVDILSTHHILSNNIGYEMNPIGFGGSTVLKGILYWYAKDQNQKGTLQGKQQAETALRYSSAFISGASLNNILVILGASNPISLASGIIFSIFLIENDKNDKNDKITTGDNK